MPILALAPSLIGAGTSLIGGLIGSRASSRAAKAQAEAGEAVGKSIDKATGQAIDAGYAGVGQANAAVDTGTDRANQYIGDAGDKQAGLYGDMTSGLQPYKEAGTYGLNKLQSQGDFKYTPQDLENDPGYQFQLAQGMKGLQSSAAARGMLQSGSALKSMMGFGQGLAGTSYQNAYNRALSTYDTNRTGYQTLAGLGQNANSQSISAGGIYGGQLTSLAGLGASTNMQGAGLKAHTALEGNEYIGNVGLRGAEAAGDARLGKANARAAGTMGSANAWSTALSGVGKAATYGLNQMNGNPDPNFTPYGSGTPWNPSAGGGGTPNPGIYTPSWNPVGPGIIGGGGETPSWGE